MCLDKGVKGRREGSEEEEREIEREREKKKKERERERLRPLQMQAHAEGAIPPGFTGAPKTSSPPPLGVQAGRAARAP